MPTWLPGAGYLKRLEDGKILTNNAFVTPVELVRKERVCFDYVSDGQALLIAFNVGIGNRKGFFHKHTP